MFVLLRLSFLVHGVQSAVVHKQSYFSLQRYKMTLEQDRIPYYCLLLYSIAELCLTSK